MENENKKLIIRGARAHNLKNINVEIPRDKLVVITGLSGKVRWPSIPSMPKDSAAMWKAYPPMPASFWDKWTSRMWIRSRAFRRQSQSTKRRPRAIPAPPWVR